MPPFLSTPRLRLRPFTEADLDRLVALDNDPGVMRYLNGGKPVPRTAIRDRTLPRVLHDYPCLAGRGDRGYWAAEERETGAFVGWFEFRPLAEDSCAEVELGYRLHRSAWGRGYATEGARALLRKGFTELGVQRVTADTMKVNTPSRNVMEKAGLTCRRTFFQSWPEAIEGSEHGEVEYALTREEWLQAEQRRP
ncbi:N-acetyltransferase [Streptomyces armeniacus]|uniref:N-acetyltransferase n=1 Tax=Streptomyces armeniacus TaxID=83291 RepID=A0A345XWW8_9ACTN|nr:GNAT family N-acetyltransferase [Streptomyces armeniacus]AXK36134.1 N-acetyltransferase [Streptomyces armeniacus]